MLATWTGQDYAALLASAASLITALATAIGHVRIRQTARVNTRKVHILTRQLHRLLEIVAQLSPQARSEFAQLYSREWEDAQEMAELDRAIAPRWRRPPRNP